MQSYQYAQAIHGRIEQTLIGMVMLPGTVVRILTVSTKRPDWTFDPAWLDFLNELGKDGWIVWDKTGPSEWQDRLRRSWLEHAVNLKEFETDQPIPQGTLTDITAYFLRREVH